MHNVSYQIRPRAYQFTLTYAGTWVSGLDQERIRRDQFPWAHQP
jgi:hypothetical protein